MNKKAHGKFYYMELTEDEVDIFKKLIENDENLRNEEFEVYKSPQNSLLKEKYPVLVMSKSPVETFRGKKYSAWEKVKRTIYVLRKKEP